MDIDKPELRRLRLSPDEILNSFDDNSNIRVQINNDRIYVEDLLTAWKGDTAANKEAAQAALLRRLMLNAKAQTGDYEAVLEVG